MKSHFLHYGGLAAGIVLAAGLLMTGPVEAQNYAAGTSPVSIPRMPDGKPDLNGVYINQGVILKEAKFVTGVLHKLNEIRKDENGNIDTLISTSRRCDPTEKGPDGIGCYENTNQQADGEFTNDARFSPNRLLYKPEYWDKVQDNDYNTNSKDPMMTCLPVGLPRIGPPKEIVQTAKVVVFLYTGWGSAGTTTNVFRVIPIAGQGPDPAAAENDISYFGTSVGHWEGDTLVVESSGFNNDTWLANGGYFHSYDMKVTERIRRDGTKLHWQATVEDPTVLLQPWVMNERTVELEPDPRVHILEGPPCTEFDRGYMVTRVRH